MGARTRPSLQQEPLWFIHRLHPEDSAYHIAFALEFLGPLNHQALEQALRAVVKAQDCLRSALPTEAGRSSLVIFDEVVFEVERASTKNEAAPYAAGEAFLQELVDRPFDLEHPPVFRFGLLERGEHDHVLGLVFHHVIFDGVSVELFIQFLGTAYKAAVEEGREVRLPLPRGSFEDFVRRQAATIDGETSREAQTYWKKALSDSQPLELPFDRPRQARLPVQGAIYRRMMAPDLVPRLARLANSLGATNFMVLLAAFEAFVGRHAGTTDVSVGTPISLRMDPSIRDRVGLFVNTIVIRTDFSDDPTFSSFVARMKETCLDAYRFHRLPFSKVVEAVAPERTMGQNPLFSVMFILQAPPEVPAFPGLTAKHRELAPRASKFDLTVAVAAAEVSFEYRTDAFDELTIEHLAERFELFLSAAVSEPGLALSSLPLSSDKEILRLKEWSEGSAIPSSPPLDPIAEQFLAQAQREPNRVVYRDEDQNATTAGELASRAARIAGGLLSRGIGPGDRIGIALYPGPELVAVALASLRIGATYVPLDPNLPPARLSRMVEDAEPKLVVIARGAFDVLEPRFSRLEIEAPRLYGAEPSTLPPVEPDRLAYIIYTSGSTGRPKGVEISHRSLAHSLVGFAAGTALPPRARWAALATFAFDISVLELYYPLLFGGTADFVPRAAARDGRALAAWVARVRPTILQTTPTRWRMLIAAGWTGHPNLVALTGGETLSVELAHSLLDRASRVVNVYGPTEGTVWSTAKEIRREELSDRCPQEGLPVGGPLPGIRLHVVDSGGHRAPIGVAGEIYLAGPQLGRGYLRLPDRTLAAFKPLPHLEELRAYATGDRGRFRHDGNLEFLGREDHQVKVRGHRIELGEVEAYLRALAEVEEAAVIMRGQEQGAESLHAYVVPKPGAAPAGRHLREALLKLLPEPMVPNTVTVMSALPRTQSGKLDRTALPEPIRDPVLATNPDGNPTDLLQLQIARVWQEVLKVPVRRDADFFELGGQSIAAVELAARLEEELDHPVSVMDVFRTRTVERLAEQIRAVGLELPWRTLVAHRPVGTRPPLFVIGASQMVAGLVHHLDPEIPLFSLNLFGLVNEQDEDRPLDIVEVAAAFIEDLRRVHPHGPYQILGYCADTKVALEMAKQLQASGEEVAFFGAVDVIERRANGTWTVGQALGLLRDFRMAYPRALLHRRRERYHLAFHRTLARTLGAAKQLVRRKLTKQQRHDLFYARYLEALAAYPAEPIDGEITFLVCTEYYRRTNERKLRNFTGRPVRVFEVPGFHETLFDEPWVETLGEQLSRALLLKESGVPNGS